MVEKEADEVDGVAKLAENSGDMGERVRFRGCYKLYIVCMQFVFSILITFHNCFVDLNNSPGKKD